MKELLVYGPTIIVCIPIVMTILLHQIHFKIKKNKWKAIHFTVQYSVFFYIIADVILLNWIISYNLLGIILIILIASLSIILILQWKNKSEVSLLEGLVLLSRISFLVFVLAYFGLLIYVVISGYMA